MRTLMVAVVLLAGVLPAAAQEITVAAASDLNYALKEIAQKYESATGTKVKLTFGSSGNFLTAIENGAPYDVFFSADMRYPQQLEAGGWAQSGTLYPYAIGRLVLWAPTSSPLDVNQGLKILADPRVRKIAIANPKHAPYGRAAEQALRKAGVYDAVESKLVLGENISQTMQFVETGNAEVGLIALSLAMSPTVRGKYWEVPSGMYEPIRQAAIVVKNSQHKEAAKKFLEFAKGEQAKEIFRRYGFAQP